MIDIAIAYSPDWERYVNIAIKALLSNNDVKNIYLLTDEEPIKQWEKAVHIDMRPYYKKYIRSDVNVDARFTRYTLYRLLMPYCIDSDKVLYLDADTLVNGDISDLYNIDMGDCIIAGVEDTGITKSQLNAIGISNDAVYVNAGVLLMNLKKIRSEGLPHTWLHLINKRWYSCHDQDVINMTCQPRIKTVSNIYNASLSTGQPENPVIIHYAGPPHQKPWNTKNVKYHDIWKKWEAAI